jgi:hypothetical protein
MRCGKLVMAPAVSMVLVGWGGSALAHHSNTAYDEKHPITVSGTVTDFEWTNPHVQIFLNVKDDKGNVVAWSIESHSVQYLKGNGWTRTSLKPGDHVTITLDPAKSGSPVGFSGQGHGKVVLDDGQVLKMDQAR